MDPAMVLAAEVAKIGGKLLGNGRIVDLTRCNILEAAAHDAPNYSNMHCGVS